MRIPRNLELELKCVDIAGLAGHAGEVDRLPSPGVPLHAHKR
jgi:hypothetical protein